MKSDEINETDRYYLMDTEMYIERSGKRNEMKSNEFNTVHYIFWLSLADFGSSIVCWFLDCLL